MESQYLTMAMRLATAIGNRLMTGMVPPNRNFPLRETPHRLRPQRRRQQGSRRSPRPLSTVCVNVVNCALRFLLLRMGDLHLAGSPGRRRLSFLRRLGLAIEELISSRTIRTIFSFRVWFLN